MYYRIQERKYSSNIIERGEYIDNKIKWTPIIAPLIKKKEGDKICKKLLNIIKNEH